MYRNQLVILLPIVLLNLFLSGCWSNQFRPQELASPINTISIHPIVKLPPAVYYKGIEMQGFDFNPGDIPGSVIGMTFYAAGKVVQGLIKGSPESMIEEYLVLNNIKIESILLDKFKHELESSPYFAQRMVQHEAEAVFHFEVKKYGLRQNGAFSPRFKPVLHIDVKLLDGSGNVLWSENEIVSHRNEDTPEYLINEYFSDARFFQNALTKSVDLVVSGLMEKLN